jgi:hypothetical protein
MKYAAAEPGFPARLELSRRNLLALLAKLDDPLSQRTLGKESDSGDLICVVAVEDDEHYSDRSPGIVYMPTSKETY